MTSSAWPAGCLFSLFDIRADVLYYRWIRKKPHSQLMICWTQQPKCKGGFIWRWDAGWCGFENDMNMMVVMVMVVMVIMGLKMFWHNSTERVCISTEMLALFELEQKIKFLLKKEKELSFIPIIMVLKKLRNIIKWRNLPDSRNKTWINSIRRESTSLFSNYKMDIAPKIWRRKNKIFNHWIAIYILNQHHTMCRQTAFILTSITTSEFRLVYHCCLSAAHIGHR